MTISSSTSRNDYPGAGIAGPFAYGYRVFAATDLQVTRRSAGGVETTLSYPLGFTATGVGDRGGGTITLATALAVGETLSIRRVLPLLQPTDLRNLGSFLPETHEDQFDRLVMIAQQQEDEIGRSLRLPVTVSPGAVSATLPVPEAGKVLAWNTGASALENKTMDSTAVALPGNGRTVATLSQYLANNVVFNVLDYGALGNGVHDDTAAFQLAASKVNIAGGWFRIPQSANLYLLTDTITFNNHGVRVAGDGWRATGIQFDPAVPKVCFDFMFSSGAFTLTNCGIAHLYGTSTNQVQKTFIRATDFSGFEIDSVRTAYAFTSGPAGTATVSPASPSIGLETRGREILRSRNLELFTDRPIQISQNPRHASIDCDFFQFTDTYLGVTYLLPVAGVGNVSCAAGAATFSTNQAGKIAVGGSITVAGVLYQINTFDGAFGATISNSAGLPTFAASAFTATAPSTEYCVTIGTAVTNEIRGLFNLHFGGENIWTGSKGGISWVSTAASADAVGITVENGRLEQSQNSAGHYINIDRNAFSVYGVRVRNVQPSIAQTGFRLRHCTHTDLETIYWADIVGINKVIDIDATVTKTRWRNLWTQTGGQASLVGQTLVFAITRLNGVDLALPTDAHYDVSTFGAVLIGNILGWQTSSRMRLASDALLINTNADANVGRWQPNGRLELDNGILVGASGTATIVTQIRKFSPSLTPSSVAANTTAEQTFTVTGLTTADVVEVNPPGLTPGTGIVGARVSAADTLKISFINNTAGPLTPVNGAHQVLAFRT